MQRMLGVLLACSACTFGGGAPGNSGGNGSNTADAGDPGGGGGSPTDPDGGGAPDQPDAGAPQPVACDGLDALPAEQTITIQSGGASRTFGLHAPPSYDPTVPTPVVVNFHGLTSNAGQQAIFSGMSAKADEAGFLVAHPEGIGASWNGGGCCGTAASSGVDDVGFVADLLDEIESIACVDTSRVYATGMSNGGFMSHRLGCDLADRFAAIAPVAGLNAAASCDPARPIPVLQIHGTGDTVVAYTGVAPTISGWVARNGCSDATEVVFESGTATCEAHRDCDEGAEVVLCTLEGFGHWWPGAFGAADDLIATDEIWAFFEGHSL